MTQGSVSKMLRSRDEVWGVFLFQAEGGIRDGHVTGVQTCALPISKRSCATCAPGCRGAAPNSGSSGQGHEQARAVSRLRRRVGDPLSPRNALVGRKRHVVLNLVYQQVESALRVRLDQLELRVKILVRFDMVAVLDLVEAIRGPVAVPLVFAPLVP